MEEDTQSEVTQEADGAQAETPSAVEEAQPSLADIISERDRILGQLKDFQRKESRLAERERKLTDIDEIKGTVAVLEERIALILDNQSEILGKAVEQPSTQPLSYQAQLRQDRETKAQGKKTTEEYVPSSEDTVAAFRVEALMQEMGWDESHPNVVKIKAQPTAQKGLEVARKLAKEDRDKQTSESVKRQLKEAGLTTPETGGPSASSVAWKGLSAEEKIRRAVQGKEN